MAASQGQMQWAVDSYALVFAGLLITGGVLGDRLGRRRVLLLGMAPFGATSALCSFAISPTQLILFRAWHERVASGRCRCQGCAAVTA
jgi:MFS family permease